jgi:hypothetical protein
MSTTRISAHTRTRRPRPTLTRWGPIRAASAALVLLAAANVAASAAPEVPSDGTTPTAGSVVDAARLTPVRVPGTKPLGAAAIDLARKGYVEREFYASGEANRYSGATSGTLTTAEVVDTNNPYKTRVLVRYPTNPKSFNGTLVVEWQNVTGSQAGPRQSRGWCDGCDF